jgi:MFS family permease
VVIEKPSTMEAYAELWRYRAVIAPLIAGLVMVGIADGGATIWAAPTLSRNFGLQPDRVGEIMATVLLVSGILGPILGGVLADSCQRAGGPRRTMSALTGLALLCIPAGFFAVAPDLTLMSALFVTFMTIGVAFNVAVTALTTVVIPNELRGICMALLSTACMISAFGVAPVVVSLLSGALGGGAMIGSALAVVSLSTSVVCATTFAFGRQFVTPAARQ